jgi:nucleotide-binding universal stress UspA family protein
VPGTIVVGVDGSEPSREALRWAAAEAKLRGSRIVAVHAWPFVPPAVLAEPGMFPIPGGADYAGQLQAEESAARDELERALAEALPDNVGVEIEPRLLEGDAGDRLVGESVGAELLVVGSSGRSGIASVLLGSVSRHVVSHAPCPVVVVKAPS